MTTADEPPDRSDDELTAAIRDVTTPVPDRLRTMAIGAYAWRTIDAELAALVDTAAVRSTTAVSSYSFEDITIDVELGPIVDGHRDVSVVVGGIAATDVALLTSGGAEVAIELDALAGKVSVPARGTVRVAVQGSNVREIVTPWMDL